MSEFVYYTLRVSTSIIPAASEVRTLRPFKAGIPNLKHYFKDMASRKEFVLELSRAEREEENLDTVFGQLWSVLSPMLSAGVYYLFIFVVQGGGQGKEFFLHLVAGVFIFEFISTAATRGANSILRAGALIHNTSFPRILLPLTDVLTALRLFVPAMGVYLVFHLFMHQSFSVQTLQVLPAFALILIFTSGLAMFAAAAQVYFRDTQALMPFLLRLVMFASPVLYYPEQAKALFDGRVLTLLNPIFCMLQIFSGSLVRGSTFDMWTWLIATGWALLAFVVGFVFHIMREGEFAARI